MTDPNETAKAAAEALKAAAETTGKAVDAARSAGGFFARVFGGALDEYAATWKEQAALYRWKNMIAIMDQVEAITAQRAVLGKVTPIPMGTAIPILDKASLEDDPGLQTMWRR